MIDVITVDEWTADVGKLEIPITFLLHRVMKNMVNLSDDAPDIHLFKPNGCQTEDGKLFAAMAKNKEMAVTIALREIGKRYEIKGGK